MEEVVDLGDTSDVELAKTKVPKPESDSYESCSDNVRKVGTSC